MPAADRAGDPRRAAATGTVPARARRAGRPTAARAAAIENTIVAAALHEFIAAGYDAATMEAVAGRAGISKSTLYARYCGKQALFRRVMEIQLGRWARLAGAQDHLLPPQLEPRLRHHARTLRRMIDRPEFRQITRLVDSAGSTFPEIAAFWRESATRGYLGFLAGDIAGAARLGGPRWPGAEPDWAFLADLFLHGFAGWYLGETAHGPVPEPVSEAYADKLITTIVAAIRCAEWPAACAPRETGG